MISVASYSWTRAVAALIVGAFWTTNPVRAVDFSPSTLQGADIGAPPSAGSTTVQAAGVTLTAGGSGIGFKSDQFHFASTPATGDFDVRVRVASLKNTDLWAKAGLMLRDGSSGTARFAGVFTTPSGAGSLFQSREVANGAASNQGAFPANQPFGWLRLARSGDVVSGYAGYDGRRWTLLGSTTLAVGADARLGLAATSHGAASTVADFQDIGVAIEPVTMRVPSPIEPLGPSSRRTALVITEIMYKPAPRSDGKNLEFVELYNSQPYFEDISGWKLAGDVGYTFPAGTVIPGGGFVVVAAAPDAMKSVYGLEQVLGPFTGNLGNGGGKLRLEGDHQAVFLDLEFKDSAPWPLQADGAGHSLVLVRPSYGEADPRAWAASRVKGGSPGAPEVVEVLSTSGLRINECQLPDVNGAGFLELFNSAAVEADLGGVRLGRSADALPYSFPAGKKLAPGGFIQLSWSELGFSGKATGDTLFVGSADGSRILDVATFGPQAPGTSAGRWPNGAVSIQVLGQPTPGKPNARPAAGIVINEIHHTPVSGDAREEFIELLNRGSANVDVSGWQFTAGVSFTFPDGTSIPAGGYLVVAHDAARLKQLAPTLTAPVFGDFTGKLRSGGERLQLSRPIAVRSTSGKSETVMAEVTAASYASGGRWHPWSDEGGSSLELPDPRASAVLSSSWVDSDETGRNGWVNVEFTGVLDNGPSGGGGFGGGAAVTPDSLHILMLGEGECLIDDIQVLGPDGVNRISNGGFEEGVTGWVFSGNHVRTSLETTEGYNSRQSLHIRATNNGDTGANKIHFRLSQALASGQTATLRAKVKWLRGWPEVLLRLHGNFLEAYGRLTPPALAGTPGARNSRAAVNAGPGFGAVTHFPAVPTVNESVTVTAEVDDPDNVGAVTLRYRLDPDSTTTAVAMRDDGTGGDAVAGDGIYSAVIPAPGTARLAAFTIEAGDGASPAATSLFPPGAPQRECLVRFGDGVQSGAFGTYRLWVTQANSEVWRNRPVLSNEPVDSTFVYADSRVVYNAGGRFAGSPFHQQFTSGPSSDAHFVIDLPKDDKVIGTSAFNKLHAPGNGAFDDTSIQREQAVQWLARQSGMPWLHRRYFHMYVNGTKRRTLMEDTQVGSNDFVEEFWPKDTEGDLYKMQPWFEFPDATATTQSLQNRSSIFVSLSRFTTTGGELKLARYRWNWLVRGANGTANNFTNALELINTVTDYANPAYAAKIEKLIDVDEWFRFFAINHAVGNWDSVGYRNQQNTYSYKPQTSPWELVIWDANIVLGNSGSDNPTSLPLFTTGDPTLSRWFAADSPFRRRFLAAYYNLANGPFQASRLGPILDAKYAAFQEHGVTAVSPDPIKTWITSARNYILTQVNKESAVFTASQTVNGSTVTLNGTGPLDMAGLQVNGSAVAVTWTSTKAWTATYTLKPGVDKLTVSAVTASGATITGATQELALPRTTVVLSVKAQGNELVLDYPVAAGINCQLQVVDVLPAAGATWRTVAAQTSGASGAQFRVLPGTSSAQFYRVLQP